MPMRAFDAAIEEIDRVRTEDPARALQLALDEAARPSTLNFPPVQLRLLERAMEISHTLQDDHGVLELFDRAFPVAVQVEDSAAQSRLLWLSACSGRILGYNLGWRIDTLTRALELVSAADIDHHARILIELALCYHEQGNFYETLESAERAFRLVPAPSYQSEALSQIARVQCAIGDFQAGAEYYYQALHADPHAPTLTQAQWYIDLGRCQIELGQLVVARQNLNQAHELLADTIHPLLGTLYLHLGCVALMLHELEEARTWFQRCVGMKPDRTIALHAEVKLAEVSLRDGEPRDAIEELKTLQQQVTSSDRQLQQQIFELLAEAYETAGDAEHSLLYLRRVTAMSKQVQRDQVAARLSLMSRKLASERMAFEKERLRARAQALEEELSSQALHFAGQIELLAEFRDQLSAILRGTDEPEVTLQKIRKHLKALPHEHIDWARFETQFSSVHPLFKQHLLEKYPDLSPMEARVSSLLRLNMKTSDIAKLFGVTERAVEFHRLNLRKKFALAKDESLHDFLTRI